MKREKIKELPIYPEQRLCKRPTTEQILRLFSLAERHTLLSADKPVQSFPPQLTDIQLQTSICSASRRNPSSAERTRRKFTSNHVCDVRNVSLVTLYIRKDKARCCVALRPRDHSQ